MNKKLLNYALLLTCISSLIFNSCRKETTQSSTSLQVSADAIAEIKQWFNTGDNIKRLSEPHNWLNKVSANWAKAESQKKDGQIVYELAINNPEQIFVSRGFVQSSDKRADRRSSIRLLVFEDLITKKRTSCFMVMVAESEQKSMDQYHYLDYGDFSGMVNFYEMDGSFANGWGYKNGKIVGKRSVKGSLPAIGKMDTKTKVNGNQVMNVQPPIPCGEETVVSYRKHCFEVGPEGESIEQCTYQAIYSFNTIYCEYSEGSGGYIPVGSGGTPDPNDPSPNIVDSLEAYPCAQALVQDMPSMKTDIATKINQLFNKSDALNILFVADPSLVADSIDGRLKSYNGNATGTAGTFKIGLNPEVLQHASKEYILVTIYHEALHAYLAHKKMTLTAAQYSAQFSGYNVNGGRLLMAQDPAHWPMAYGAFVNGLSSTIKSFNTSFDHARADALAAGGITVLTSGQKTINLQERNTRVPGYTGTKCINGIE